MATRRRASSKQPAEPPRRPSLHWRPDSPAGLLPHELEADAIGVLVGLIEWASHVGLDFETLLTRARQTVAERRGARPRQRSGGGSEEPPGR